MMQRQQIAMEVIKKVCADIDHDYGCGVDVENEVVIVQQSELLPFHNISK